MEAYEAKKMANETLEQNLLLKIRESAFKGEKELILAGDGENSVYNNESLFYLLADKGYDVVVSNNNNTIVIKILWNNARPGIRGKILIQDENEENNN